MFSAGVSEQLQSNKTIPEAGISMESVVAHRLSRNLFYCFASHCHTATLDIVQPGETKLKVTGKLPNGCDEFSNCYHIQDVRVIF